MDKRKHLLAFMFGLAAALSLSAAFSRSHTLQGISAPLINPVVRQGASAEITVDNYTISWYTIDSGGGTSQGGSYELRYTIGQPDASTPAGSPINLHNGFWAGVFQFWNNHVPLVFKP